MDTTILQVRTLNKKGLKVEKSGEKSRNGLHVSKYNES